MTGLLNYFKEFWHWLGALLLDGLLADLFAWLSDWLFS